MSASPAFPQNSSSYNRNVNNSYTSTTAPNPAVGSSLDDDEEVPEQHNQNHHHEDDVNFLDGDEEPEDNPSFPPPLPTTTTMTRLASSTSGGSFCSSISSDEHNNNSLNAAATAGTLTVTRQQLVAAIRMTEQNSSHHHHHRSKSEDTAEAIRKLLNLNSGSPYPQRLHYSYHIELERLQKKLQKEKEHEARKRKRKELQQEQQSQHQNNKNNNDDREMEENRGHDQEASSSSSSSNSDTDTNPDSHTPFGGNSVFGTQNPNIALLAPSRRTFLITLCFFLAFILNIVSTFQPLFTSTSSEDALNFLLLPTTNDNEDGAGSSGGTTPSPTATTTIPTTTASAQQRREMERLDDGFRLTEWEGCATKFTHTVLLPGSASLIYTVTPNRECFNPTRNSKYFCSRAQHGFHFLRAFHVIVMLSSSFGFTFVVASFCGSRFAAMHGRRLNFGFGLVGLIFGALLIGGGAAFFTKVDLCEWNREGPAAEYGYYSSEKWSGSLSDAVSPSGNEYLFQFGSFFYLSAAALFCSISIVILTSIPYVPQNNNNESEDNSASGGQRNSADAEEDNNNEGCTISKCLDQPAGTSCGVSNDINAARIQPRIHRTAF